MAKSATVRRSCLALALVLAGQATGQTYSKTEVITYHDNTAKWVVGQTASVACTASAPASTACDGDVVRAMTFDTTYALPVTFSSFGKLRGTYGYDTTATVASGQLGTFKTATDGNSHSTTFSQWTRGIPKLVQSADATSQTAVVDNATGWISSVTDQNGYSTVYGYDAMGRLASIVYPTGDTTAWNTSTRSFVPVATTEYGIPAGHWRETASTGNGVRVSYYDALWRPLLAREYDAGNVAATEHFTKTTYDAGGRVQFTSYPSTSSAPTTGAWSYYDALGRVTSVSQDSELGLLTSTTAYGSPFTTTVTNPRTKATTTSYLTYDQPTTDLPLGITSPEGVTTTITRDAQGKPLAVRRDGTYGGQSTSLTRSYVYDVNQRLCQTVNPESGVAIVDYDGAGNVLWSAEGQAATGLTETTCATARANTLASARTLRTIDPMNRVTYLATPGGTADIATTYEPDGLVKKLTAANPGGVSVVTDYSYNRRRLLLSENSSQPGWYLTTIGYGYNANGHLASLTYPDMQQVTYAPDALGRPTQVGTYATAITYYPNGAISGFNYGNGLVRALTQNARLLPSTSVDKKPDNSVVAISDTLTYDPNGNVLGIADGVPGGLTGRTMSYDGLDRLISASSPNQWGTATYGYDALDNLRLAEIGGAAARQYRYNYNATSNLLTDIKSPLGATVFGFGYDARGNQTLKGTQGYQFDAANRLTSVTGKEDYRYDGLGRRVFAWSSPGTIMLWQYAQDGRELYASDGRRSQNRTNIYLGNTVLVTRTVDWGTGTANVRYLHTDALGSPVAETGPTGLVLKRNSYEPYGAAYGANSIDGIGYTGHVMDQATGLTYMQQRYYDPQLQRFISVDPIASDTTTAWNFNRYWYANDNPYKFTDPDGRCPDKNPCWEATPSNFFRDTFVGSVIGHIVGDPIAVVRSDSLNPLTNTVLDKREIQDAKLGVLLLAAPLGKLSEPAKASFTIEGHVLDQVAARGMSLDSVKAALANPLKITAEKLDSLGRPSVKYIGDKATAAVNPETLKVTTAHPTSTRTAEKLLREGPQ